ncbi:dTDP-glucose 4,6-dehydratase [Methylorubrum extorquens]|uniref:PhoX family protein n=1 Tax=Methylorubrum extorquens TaxID=408 RepID=UPI00116FE994|nr:PhoX family phosphatase [Methylorubrum extorquens]GEL41042.1 dTDP-glucose 4,6-dehydratase [Methylorubrum extorquens]
MSDTPDAPTLDAVIAQRFSRRDLMRGSLAAALAAGLAPQAVAAPADSSAFDFPELAAGIDEHLHVAEGYEAKPLLRWGDPLFPDAPAFDPQKQSARAQERQFGYNNDFVGFIPLDAASQRGLLMVNHEYTNAELMFPGLAAADRKAVIAALSPEQVAIEMAAHGGSVVEIVREAEGWRPVIGSPYTRRITAETPIALTGPAAGHPRLMTEADPSGRRVLGMINNCSGGVTPWGTWLSGEENINYYFSGTLPSGHAEAGNAKAIGLGSPQYAWSRFHPRFDLAQAPNEPNRFGWVVEIDPFDPASTPKKRTALGRFKHEGAAGARSLDGRYVVYLGDDERFQHVYRFVSDGRVQAEREANAELLDSGTLSVARFEPDGTGRWLPLVHGANGLDAGNGFASQADVLIEARRAAKSLGATPMDRPEDIEANPRTGRVYVMLTNNGKRTADQEEPANPRGPNTFGHVIEITPDGTDHAAETFCWEVLVRCGDPAKPEVKASFSALTTQNGWFGMPDNCTVDGRGRLWIATDGNNRRATGRADGIWALETEGPRRGTARHFLRVPVGAEMCGPCFTPDDETFFVAVQHPGEPDEEGALGSYEKPSTRWPDFSPDLPPRPSVVAVRRTGGGRIG